jgi:PKD repeat protein
MLLVTAIVVSAVMSVGAGDALAAKNHSVSATGKVAGVGTSGGRTVDVGVFRSTLGEIVAVFRVKAGSNGKLSVTFTAYNRNGTLKGTSQLTPTTNAAGGTDFTGTAKIIGGTGLFAGATGKLSATGTSPKGSTIVSYKLKGTVRY